MKPRAARLYLAVTDFGRDISCLDGLRTARQATGAQLVAEAAYRRLITPRGTLHGGDGENDYGFDLADMIGAVTSSAQRAAIESQAQMELLKDERLNAVDVSIVEVKTGPSTSWTVTIKGETDAGPFDLVLSVSEATVQLLGLAA